MNVNNKILKRKFIGDIPEKEMKRIEKVCEIEKRTRISLIRKATMEYVEKILGERKQNAKPNSKR